MAHFDNNPNLYGWDEPELRLAEVRQRGKLLLGIGAVLTLACGVVPTGVARDPWVGFFGTAALAAVMFEAIGLVRFVRAEERLSHRSFMVTHWMLVLGALLHAGLMLGAAVAGVVCCIRAFTGAADVVLVLGYCAAAACSAVLLHEPRAEDPGGAAGRMSLQMNPLLHLWEQDISGPHCHIS